jgi:plasmid replication initiation protein
MKKDTGSQIAVVSNQIVRARHALDARQQKMLAWAIAQIARDDTGFLTARMSVAEFTRLTGSSSGSTYREMAQVSKSLLREIVEIQTNEGNGRRVAFQWLSRCVYTLGEGTGTVELCLHDELRPYLLELKARFTQLSLDRMFKLRSSYTIRFFERIEMERGLKHETFSLSVDGLRDWVGLKPEMYPKFGLLRKGVIDIARNELDAKADYSFSYSLVKTGRKITSIDFRIRPARSPKGPPPAKTKWQKATPEIRAKVFALARELTRWEGEMDAEIEADPLFEGQLPALLERAETGQAPLDMS